MLSLDPCGRQGDDVDAVQPGTALAAKGEGPPAWRVFFCLLAAPRKVCSA